MPNRKSLSKLVLSGVLASSLLVAPSIASADPNMTILDEHRYADQKEREQRERDNRMQANSSESGNGSILGKGLVVLLIGGVLCGVGVICSSDAK